MENVLVARYTNWDDVPILMDTNEVAELLELAPVTIKAWVKAGLIPSVKIGRARRFQKEEIKRWIEERDNG